MSRHLTLKGMVLGAIIISIFLTRITSFSYQKCLLYTLATGLCSWILYRSFVYPFFFSPLRHIPTVSGRWAGLISHLPQRLSQEMGAVERDWHLKHGPIVRYFMLPLGVERLAVADIEALRDINLRYTYRFAKPQRIINWMKPVLGEKGILLVRFQDIMCGVLPNLMFIHRQMAMYTFAKEKLWLLLSRLRRFAI